MKLFSHADEDKKRKEIVEARNGLDGLIFQAEKMIKDNGDKIPDDLKKEVEDGITEAKGKLESNDLDALNTAKTEFEGKLHKMAEAVYKQAGAEGGAQQAPGADAGAGGEAAGSAGNAGKDDVVDAEFEDSSK